MLFNPQPGTVIIIPLFRQSSSEYTPNANIKQFPFELNNWMYAGMRGIDRVCILQQGRPSLLSM